MCATGLDFDGAGVAGSALRVDAAGERSVNVSVESCVFTNFYSSALAVEAQDSSAVHMRLTGSTWTNNNVTAYSTNTSTISVCLLSRQGALL